MSLNQNQKIDATDINSLKDAIQAELNRRNQYDFSSIFSDVDVQINGNILDTNFNNLINPLNVINSDTLGYASVAKNNIIQSIKKLSTVLTGTFTKKAYYGTDSGCKAGCIGLCQGCTGTCSGTCTGCTGGCTSCSGGCEETCTGCTGECTGCKNTCTGCTKECNGVCTVYCGGVCAINGSQSGGGGCTGAACGGNCSSTCYGRNSGR